MACVETGGWGVFTTPARLTTFVGRAGDRNDRAMAAARIVGDRIAERRGLVQHVVGAPQPALGQAWGAELVAARTPLAELARAVGEAAAGSCLTVLPRCAGALATQPALAARHEDLAVVWFDAHADLHLPTTTASGYLGGMALSAPLGWWQSGLGEGVRDAVLVGARAIDAPERKLAAERGIPVVRPGRRFPDDLARHLDDLGDRPVSVHLDADVLEPGLLSTEYTEPGGLSLDDLARAAAVLADRHVVALEIAEIETGPDGTLDAAALDPLLDALAPLLDGVVGR